MLQCNDLLSFLAVQLALIFSHTEKYPDEPPLLNVKRLVHAYPFMDFVVQTSYIYGHAYISCLAKTTCLILVLKES